jgi:hypothetical protein
LYLKECLLVQKNEISLLIAFCCLFIIIFKSSTFHAICKSKQIQASFIDNSFQFSSSNAFFISISFAIWMAVYDGMSQKFSNVVLRQISISSFLLDSQRKFWISRDKKVWEALQLPSFLEAICYAIVRGKRRNADRLLIFLINLHKHMNRNSFGRVSTTLGSI